MGKRRRENEPSSRYVKCFYCGEEKKFKVFIKYVGALRAPPLRRFAPVTFFKYDGAVRAPRLRRFAPVAFFKYGGALRAPRLRRFAPVAF